MLNWIKNLFAGNAAGQASGNVTLDNGSIEALVALQEEEGVQLFLGMRDAGPGLVSWGMKLQQRFFEVLEEKESYVADRSALPYPEPWIRLAFKVQALRCVVSGQEELLSAIENGLKHLASFQAVNPRDVDHLALVERYREEILKYGFSPGAEDDTVLSDGTSLRDVLKSYARALPTFNRYHDAIEEKKKAYLFEFASFVTHVRAGMKGA